MFPMTAMIQYNTVIRRNPFVLSFFYIYKCKKVTSFDGNQMLYVKINYILSVNQTLS